MRTNERRMSCQTFIRAYPIRDGTANTMWCSFPSDGARCCLERRVGNWEKIFHALARQKECQIMEGHLMPDHVHMCIAIPPKHPVASVIGFLKGKSAIAVARLCGKERNFTGEHFWARGYAVSTVGFELEQVRQYIREQEEADGTAGSSESLTKARFSATPKLMGDRL